MFAEFGDDLGFVITAQRWRMEDRVELGIFLEDI
jgi:hypothetical protein